MGLALGFILKSASVQITQQAKQEIAPPWVGPGLAGEATDPRAIPLDRFIEGTLTAVETDAEEVLVEEAKVYSNNAGPNEHAFVTELNTVMTNELASV